MTLERSDSGDGKPGASHGWTGRVLENVRLTHPDRVLYPQQGLTKRGLAEYYVEVADWMLPHVAGRPLSLVRCPWPGQGVLLPEAHRQGLPASLREVMIKESEGEGPIPCSTALRGCWRWCR